VPAPTTTNLGRNKRKRRQRCKERYAKAREDAQLLGIIPTVPEGAVRDEVAPVAPDPPLPHLVRAALRQGWDVPEAAKARIVAELLAAFFEEGQDPMLKVRLARLLLLLDQTQWERDHPDEAGKAKGGSAVAVSVQANVQAVALLNEMIERDHNLAADKPAQQANA
jgi:hypothetical protein